MLNIGSQASKRTEQNLIQNLFKMWTSMPMWPPRMIVELEEGWGTWPDDNALPYACGKKNGVAERAEPARTEVAFYLLKTRLPRNDRSDASIIVGLFVTCDVCGYGQHSSRGALTHSEIRYKKGLQTSKPKWERGRRSGDNASVDPAAEI